MIRAASVENDEGEERLLEEQLARYGHDRNVETTCVHYGSAEAFLDASYDVDVVFMDIDLPGMNGMDAAAQMRRCDATTQIVFVTSLAQYAVKGYEVDAAGFIVKPVRFYDMAMCLDKVRRVISRNVGENVTIRTQSGLYLFPVSDIEYVETSGHDLVYHFSSGAAPIRVRDSLGRLAESLEDKPFIRVSQGQLVNMMHVVRVAGDSLTLSGGETLFFSRRCKRNCLDRIAQYMGRTI
ncbi:DNA-binding response regulator [Olsenella sp. AF16-14LB]|jgi:two-component system response regulator LytT|uniref:LytR/AlgR family response regulator transcription factor n=1 Tax=unclassified Olsenella TaxID=2638792 RepID=UPI000E432303|nr:MULTISPECIES: LytTR family DNA-binding domain-containing protein [unclassified Olsenella]RGJ46439.1 DNA-binding response regulator [Olsenella sp. TM06-36]RGS52540.1 DNA-binding response regulator [Olsenella sp. AF21-51]RGU52465.1 DNA-binding response regulator [Olsenella sp. AF16-14LB]RGU83707.1 DNA-binding response regulator [Olsenella sp. AF15-43LB]RHJ94780.1 DNA-binding response regulator [Olsenella sp. AM05-7]